MKEIYYECYFKFKGDIHCVEADAVYKFTEGFWVDDWIDYTVYDKATYWIPPAMIKYIEKKTRTVRKTRSTQ